MRFINRSSRQDSGFALVCVDVDDFKKINDTLAHAGGDAVLIRIGQVLAQSVRKEDTVARLGDDEFVLLLADLNERSPVARILEKLVGAFAVPIPFGGTVVTLGVSMGVHLCRLNEGDEREWLMHADLAMYNVKHSGGNGYAFSSPRKALERIEGASVRAAGVGSRRPATLAHSPV